MSKAKQKEKRYEKMSKSYITINLAFVFLFIIFEIFGIFIYKDVIQYQLLSRVLSRGDFGLLILYNSLYLLLTSKVSFVSGKQSRRQRNINGLILGVVGLIMIITALMGYGTNGDPRLYWWK